MIYYGCAARDASRGHLDLSRVSLKAMLVSGSYEPDLERDATVDDLRHVEIRPTGSYRPGGAHLIRTDDGGDGHTRFTDLVDCEFRYAILHRTDTGGLVGYFDYGQQRWNGNLEIIWGYTEPEPAPTMSVDAFLASVL